MHLSRVVLYSIIKLYSSVQVFNNFDVNGDGNIDIQELTTVLNSLGFDPSPEQLQSMIDQVL